MLRLCRSCIQRFWNILLPFGGGGGEKKEGEGRKRRGEEGKEGENTCFTCGDARGSFHKS